MRWMFVRRTCDVVHRNLTICYLFLFCCSFSSVPLQLRFVLCLKCGKKLCLGKNVTILLVYGVFSDVMILLYAATSSFPGVFAARNYTRSRNRGSGYARVNKCFSIVLDISQFFIQLLHSLKSSLLLRYLTVCDVSLPLITFPCPYFKIRW